MAVCYLKQFAIVPDPFKATALLLLRNFGADLQVSQKILPANRPVTPDAADGQQTQKRLKEKPFSCLPCLQVTRSSRVR
jgi:hypothetical protein